MSFINMKEGTVNFLICELGTSAKRRPSDPSFAIGSDRDHLRRIGLTHEVIGPDPEDGGPMLYCVCPNAEIAQAIKSALELVRKL